MEKPQIKVADGIVHVSMSAQLDNDKDGKASVKGSMQLELDAYELVTEIAKKDIALLELILKQVKVG